MTTNATGAVRAPGVPDEGPFTGMFFKLDAGTVIGYFSECTGLEAEYEVMEYGEGGVNDFVHKLRGRAKYPNLTLRRGITSATDLMDWFQRCRDRTERRDVTITLLGPNLAEVRSWSFAGGFPVKWTGPDFKANATEAATETLEVAHQGLKEV